MTNDPRSALNRLIAAFEAHLDAAATGDDLSPAVVAAENALQDAFFTYDDALFTAYGIELPFDIVDADDEVDEDDYDEEYEAGLYEITCPQCGEVVCVDEDMLANDDLACPNCGTKFEVDFSEDDDACEGCEGCCGGKDEE